MRHITEKKKGKDADVQTSPYRGKRCRMFNIEEKWKEMKDA